MINKYPQTSLAHLSLGQNQVYKQNRKEYLFRPKPKPIPKWFFYFGQAEISAETEISAENRYRNSFGRTLRDSHPFHKMGCYESKVTHLKVLGPNMLSSYEQDLLIQSSLA